MRMTFNLKILEALSPNEDNEIKKIDAVHVTCRDVLLGANLFSASETVINNN